MKLKRTWIFILLTLCVTLTFSCKYGSGNVFYEYNSVDNRVNSLKKLTPAEGVSVPAGQPFSFMVLSDIHFGSIRADGNPLPLNEFWAWMDSKQASSSLPDFIFSSLNISLASSNKGNVKSQSYSALSSQFCHSFCNISLVNSKEF